MLWSSGTGGSNQEASKTRPILSDETLLWEKGLGEDRYIWSPFAFEG